MKVMISRSSSPMKLRVAVDALDPELHRGRKVGIERDEVAPGAAGAGHLPLHLHEVRFADRLGEQRVEVRGGQRAFDLDQARYAGDDSRRARRASP